MDATQNEKPETEVATKVWEGAGGLQVDCSKIVKGS